MIAKLIDACRDDTIFRRVTMAGYAAFNAALDDIVERAESRGLRLIGLWGMSEMQALVARRDPESDSGERGKAGGRLVSASGGARVRDPESGRLLPGGEAGELEITGPSRMREYFENQEATRETVTEDGFVRTGDLAVMESDGGFEFLSRMGDVLRLGGYLVSPAEIEGELKTHPSVAGAQVVSTPTPGGERAVAFVIPQSGITLECEDVRAHCARRLARYKVPAKVVTLDEFPVTVSANGIKIQRTRLRELAAGLLVAGD
jgi:fatty-acyl-CoA synthase